jgi:hypothetical protein
MNMPLSPTPPLREALNPFPPVPPSCTVQGCPKLAKVHSEPSQVSAPTEPCNLKELKIVEASASPSWEQGARSADFLRLPERQRQSCPVRLRTGVDVFQITAPSAREKPRVLDITVVQEAWCGDKPHRHIAVAGPASSTGFDKLQTKLELHRAPLATDSVDPADQVGLFTLVNLCFQKSAQPLVHHVSSVTCGLPPGASSAPLADLAGRIEVFPADKYKLELEIPAFLKSDKLKLEGKSDSWKTDDEMKAAKAAAEAKSYYKEYKEALKEVGISRSDVKAFASDMAKRKSGEDDHGFIQHVEASFSQTDGNRQVKFPAHDVVKLVRQIRKAEEYFKDVTQLVSQCTRGGLGASIEAEVQFLVLALEAQWGWCEHTDDRVYWRWEATLDMWVAKAKIVIAAGVRYAGFADLYLEFSAEGSLGFTAEAKLKDPEGKIEWANRKPKGELKGSGMLKSELFWCVSGETGVKCEWKANFDEFKFMDEGKVFGGKIVIERGPVLLVTKVSCRVFGGQTTTKDDEKNALMQKGTHEFDLDTAAAGA